MQKKLEEVGHKLDDFVEKKSEKHSFTKFQIWLGLLMGAITVVAVVKWVL